MKKHYQALIVLSICFLFLFIKYLAQLFPSLINNDLTQQFLLSGLQIGILASSYYYSYTIMQIISGVVLDKFDIRIPAFLSILTIAIGLFGFAHTDSFISMCLYRVLMGIGCSFATTLYMKAATIWTSEKTFTFISSLLATATMLGAAVGSEPVALLFNKFGWGQGLAFIAYLGFALAILALFFVKSGKPIHLKTTASFAEIKNVVFNRSNLWLLLYSGVTFSPVVILGGLWGVPFLQLKYNESATHVAFLISIMFIGHAVGSPTWALLSTALRNKKQIMMFANAISFLSLLIILFISITYLQAEILFFIFGFCVGSFMLSFDICRQVNNVMVMGFAVAFINSGEGIVGSFLEPGIGLLLDLLKEPGANFSIQNYQSGLIILPFCYVISTLIISKLPSINEDPNPFKSMWFKQSLKFSNTQDMSS